MGGLYTWRSKSGGGYESTLEVSYHLEQQTGAVKCGRTSVSSASVQTRPGTPLLSLAMTTKVILLALLLTISLVDCSYKRAWCHEAGKIYQVGASWQPPNQCVRRTCGADLRITETSCEDTLGGDPYCKMIGSVGVGSFPTECCPPIACY
ncbi:uncharacterized protein LOC121853120 [Homarus americanus]|uniref:uncharacterized protein LOC121853120 n=1 Tax=Homarus americanus TaxID=6706 RepID=UPI001C45814B|nr:uncharacterized protein LOC121853120 [Homarus americanus]